MFVLKKYQNRIGGYKFEERILNEIGKMSYD